MGMESEAINTMTEEIKTAILEYLKTAPFDKTKVGTIVEVLGNNKYSVMIEGSVYTVPSYSSQTYNVREAVSILYPQNNSKRKRIIGREV